jgi:integrase
MAQSKIELGGFLDTWLQDYIRAKVRPQTFRSYSSLVRVHIGPALGNIAVKNLSVNDVQQFLNNRLATCSSRTVRYLHAVLRAALKKAKRLGIVDRNVAEDAEPPRAEVREIQPLSPPQIHRFIDTIRGDRLEALYLLAISTGLRQGELLGLRWSNIDLDNRTITVRLALQRVNGKLQLVEPKTKKSRRTIALPQIAADALREHKLRQDRDRAKSVTWPQTDFVFTTLMGKPLDGCNVTRRFKRLLIAAGLPPLRFHDLRHTCASLLIAQSIHPRTIMEVLGHSQIAVTMDTYGHAFATVRRKAARKMDAILRSSPRFA